MKNFYHTLLIQETSSQYEIKRAFGLHSLERYDNPAQFIETFQAYEVLSNKKIKKTYDNMLINASSATTNKLEWTSLIDTHLNDAYDNANYYLQNQSKFKSLINWITFRILVKNIGWFFFRVDIFRTIFLAFITTLAGLSFFRFNQILMGLILTTVGIFWFRHEFLKGLKEK